MKFGIQLLRVHGANHHKAVDIPAIGAGPLTLPRDFIQVLQESDKRQVNPQRKWHFVLAISQN